MNLPNKLTTLRIVLIPIMLWLIMQDHILKFSIGYTIAILIGLTDYLDGYIARRYKAVTRFGEFIDPLADKIFVISLFVYCVKISLIPGWLFILLLSREIAVTDLRIFASTKNINIKVNALGKTKTLLQNLLLLYFGAVHMFYLLSIGNTKYEIILHSAILDIIRILLLSSVAIFTFSSMWLYIANFYKQYCALFPTQPK
ncbi:MAG: CDP-diacylglycerol--glycerol-3-phosphate 3-phosphatidyltransferase [Chlamydiota bacterium]|nr:CDP-diacylglycerol--glycerol-3-phosphate 3-phosphatidyltransferase [Chlamydiota bacterium]